MKNIRALLLAALMLCSVLMFAACGEQGSTEPQQTQPAGYQVKVVDALGAPYTGDMIVRFLQNGQQAAMQKMGEDGVATKELPDGEYTVELQFMDEGKSYYYDKTDLTVNADKKELTIVLSYAVDGEGRTLNAQGKEITAYAVGVGCTYLELTAGERNYFLFTPEEAGKYQFSLVDSDAPIGYYGAPHFVQETSAAEVVDNMFTQNIKAGMISTSNTGTTVLVVGIDAPAEGGSVILAIERLGDPDRDITDEPWHIYQTTGDPTPWTLPAGASLGEFDLTADSYNLVRSETDGFYHLNSADGPLVLVRLGEKSGGSKYLDSYQTILDHTGVNKYFFDENGEFVKKESYSECLLKYIECMDKDSGLYPLTEDLKYIIQQSGDHNGWFREDSSIYLFKDGNGANLPGINSEISWLFMCCYIEG